MLAFVFEGWTCFIAVSAYLGHYQKTAYLMAFILHIVAVSLLFLVPTLQPEKGRQDIIYYTFLCGLLTLLLPVIGLFGCCLMFFLVKKIFKATGSVDAYQEATRYVIEGTLYSDTIENVETFINRELSIEPIVDMLAGEDEDFKRGAIKHLGRIGSPRAVRLLKKCFADPSSSEVQFYAHASLRKLEESYISHINKLKALVDSNEGERSENLRQLGNAYRKYAESGFPVEDSRDHYLNLAKEAFLQVLLLDPEDARILLVLGELCLAGKEYSKAASYFNKAVESASESAEALIGLCQTYYEKGNMAALKKTVMRMNSTGDPGHRLDGMKTIMFQFWANIQEA